MPMVDTSQATECLDRWFDRCPSAAVAFSGGVDSALVAFWARRCLGRDRSGAWTAASPSLKRSDLEGAKAFCAAHDIVLHLVRTNEIDNPAYACNPVNRCYHCKKTLYRTIRAGLSRPGSDVWLCSGANADDRDDYRPGLLAAAEDSVRHPLLECSIGKETVRALARQHGLEVWNNPASPCLSSRIPYGQPVSVEKLARIEAAETWMAGHGFAESRVRHYSTVARVEVPAERIPELELVWLELVSAFAGLGFAAVELDCEGLVSGKLNRGIGKAGNGERT